MRLLRNTRRALLASVLIAVPFLWIFRGLADGETYAETWYIARDPVFAEARDFPPQTRWIGDASAALINRPVDYLIARELERGALPLWNPHQSLGAPLHAQTHNMALAPLRLLTVTLPGASDMAVSVFLILQYLLGAYGAYLWLRECCFGVGASILGAFFFVLNGTMFAQLRFSGPPAVMFEPWLLFAVERLLRRPGLRQALFAGVVAGMICYVSHPVFNFLALMSGGLWGIVRLAQLAHDGAPALRRERLKWLLISGIAGVTIGSGGWVPFVELLEFGWIYKSERPLPPWIPPLFQLLDHTRDMDRLFIAAGFWPLVAAGLWARSPYRLPAALILVIGFGMTYDVGPFALHGTYLVDAIATTYTVHLLPLGGCVLVALLLSRRIWTRKAALGAVLSAAAVAAVFYFAEDRFEDFWGYADERESRPTFAVLSAGLVVLTVGIRLVRPWFRERADHWVAFVGVALALSEILPHATREIYPEPTFELPSTPAQAAIVEHVRPGQRVVGVGSDRGPMVLRPNLSDAIGVDDVRSSAPVFVDRSHRLLTATLGWTGYPTHMLFPQLPGPGFGEGSQGIDVLGVRWVLATPSTQVPAHYRTVYRDRFLALHENPSAFDRAYLVHAAVPARDPDEALARARSLDLRRAVVLEIDEPRVGETPMDPPEGERVELISYTADVVELEVVASADGYLVLSDTYYPGWQATVDGEAAEIHPANVAFRAVYVPEGRHRVVFRYRPLKIYAALWLSILGVLAWLLVSVRDARRASVARRRGAPRRG